jgi:hypothetical protein
LVQLSPLHVCIHTTKPTPCLHTYIQLSPLHVCIHTTKPTPCLHTYK